MDLTLNLSTVALEHTNTLKSVQCTDDTLTMAFKSHTAFQFVARTWPAHNAEFILATYFPGCAGWQQDERGYSIVKSFKLLESSLTVVANVVDMNIKSVAQEFQLQWGVSAPSSNTSALSKRYTKSGSVTVDIDAAPDSSSLVSTSAFGMAYPIFESTALSCYCVNCGVSGSMTMSGSIGWSIWHPTELESGSVDINGNLAVEAAVGISVQKSWTDTKSKEIFSQGLPGLSIAGIFTIGPEISASAAIGLTFDAQAELLAGFSLDWPAFDASMDLVAGTSSSSGWQPTFSPIAEAHGEFTVTVSPSLPVSLSLGIDIFSGLISKSIALIETPSLAFSATVAGSVGINSREIIPGSDAVRVSPILVAPVLATPATVTVTVSANSCEITSGVPKLSPNVTSTSVPFSSSAPYSAPYTSLSPSSFSYSTLSYSTIAPPASAFSVPVPTTLATSTQIVALSSAVASVPAAVSTSASDPPAYCDPGINLSVGFVNTVTLNVLDIHTFTLNTWTSPTINKCITF